MSLSTSELQRIKFELGFNVLTIGAEPFIGTTILFEQIVAVYIQAGAATTSSTAVTAASTPTPVAITLASATGFASGARIWFDVDERQESATIQNLAGSIATVALSKAHSGTYPVYVDGGEAIVREILDQIRRVKLQMLDIYGEGALKKVDEIEFFGLAGNLSLFGSTAKVLEYWRRELSSALGVPYLWESRKGGGSGIALY